MIRVESYDVAHDAYDTVLFSLRNVEDVAATSTS
jgi:hypothetical protein